MAERYARLYAKAAENPDIGELLETQPLTVALWFLCIARADLYGILPGEPRRFRAVVAPAAALPSATVEQCTTTLEKLGWVRRYTDANGNDLLHIVKYHELQDVRWANRIGPPDHELPPWWEPPGEFIDMLKSVDLAKVRGKAKREKWAELQQHYCSTTVVLPQNNPTQDTRHKTQNDNDSLSEPDDGSDAAEIDKPKAKPRKVLSEDEYQQQVTDLRARIPSDCHPLVDAYLDAAAAENKRGQITAGRAMTLTTELADAADEFAETPGAFRYGLEAAINASAPNRNYVRKAARGYDPQKHQERASPDPFAADGRRPESEWTDAERQIAAHQAKQAQEAARAS